MIDMSDDSMMMSMAYGVGTGAMMHEHTFQACSGKMYKFCIRDDSGDGLCCDYGDGFFTIVVEGEVMAEGSNFDTEECTEIMMPTLTVEPSQQPSKKTETSAPTKKSESKKSTKSPTPNPFHSASPSASPTHMPSYAKK